MEIVEMIERELVFETSQLPNEDAIISRKELAGISKVLESMPFAALVGAASAKHIKGAFPNTFEKP